MSEYGGRRGGWAGRASLLWLLVVSPMVCVATGAFFGGAWLAGATAWRSPSVGLAARTFAIGCLYSLLVAGPFGLVMGVGGAVLAKGLSGHALCGASLVRWLRTGAWVGAIPASACGLFLLVLGAQSDRGLLGVSFVALAGVAGACAGACVAGLAWREFGACNDLWE